MCNYDEVYGVNVTLYPVKKYNCTTLKEQENLILLLTPLRSLTELKIKRKYYDPGSDLITELTVMQILNIGYTDNSLL